MYNLHLSIAKYLRYEVLSMWSVSPLNALFFFFKSEKIIIINQVFGIYTYLSGSVTGSFGSVWMVITLQTQVNLSGSSGNAKVCK